MGFWGAAPKDRSTAAGTFLLNLTTLHNKSDAALVALYGEVTSELHRRGVVRSGNNPIADIAERVIADYYGVERQPPNHKSYDVVTKDGTKIEVKVEVHERLVPEPVAPALARVRLCRSSHLRNRLQLIEAIFVPLEAVRDHMRWSNTWKANRLSVTQKLLNDPRVRRVPAAELVS
jgi:hypothetical protein